MVVFGKSGYKSGKVVVFGKFGCIPAKWLCSSNKVVFRKSGFNRENGCIRPKVVVFGQSGCISTKVVEFRQSGCNRAKMVVFGEGGCICEKTVVLGQK